VILTCTLLGCAPSEEEPTRIRIGQTATGIEVVYDDLQHVDWLQQRRQDQLATVSEFDVFHAFAFADRQRESGIDFKNQVVPCAAEDYKSVHYDHGNGVLVDDVDGDGKYDLFFLSQVGGNALWRNLGGGRFENITQGSGLAMLDTVNVSGAFGDIDNDGDPDLYVTTVRQGNRLFENDGSGRFADITDAAGLAFTGHSSGAVFFDFDRDGLLDLFVTNVGTYTTDEQAPVRGDGSPSYWVGMGDAFHGHLHADRPEASILYRNLGENRFADVSEQVGLVDKRWSGDASTIDGNGDGWPDLYVLNMMGHDEYYENIEGKRFVAKGRELFPNTPWGAMGVKVFDYNNDGHMDLYLTDMHSDMSHIVGPADEKKKSDMQWREKFLQSGGMSIFGNAFYRGSGGEKFTEISDQVGAENFWPWGLSVGDLNADGYEDVFVASGMNYPFRYGVNTVLLNNNGERFLDSEFVLGVEPRRSGENAVLWFEVDCTAGGQTPDFKKACEGADRVEVWGAKGTRSSVIFDLDDDGDLDIVTNEFGSVPMVLISDLADNKAINYLKVDLVGSKSNRDGLGARVTVTTSMGSYTKIQDGVSGYLSHSVFPLYFGLGDADTVERVEVAWPSGTQQVISEGIVTNDVLEIVER
jgi:hypothetical protein